MLVVSALIWAVPVLAPADTTQLWKYRARDPVVVRLYMPSFTAERVEAEISTWERVSGSCSWRVALPS